LLRWRISIEVANHSITLYPTPHELSSVKVKKLRPWQVPTTGVKVTLAQQAIAALPKVTDTAVLGE